MAEKAKRAKKRKVVKTPPSEVLTAQQERFCREYIIDYHGTNAATRAGYSERSAHVTASRLLKNAKVLARVRELQGEQAERLCITADRVMMELAKVAFVDPGRLIDLNTGKVRADAGPNERASIASVRVKHGDGLSEYETKTYDKIKALELIGKRLGLFTDNVNLAGDMTFDVKVDYGEGEPEAEEKPKIGFDG